MLRTVRLVLNRHLPFDAIARWWYLLVAVPASGILFSLLTNVKPFSTLEKQVIVLSGQYPNIQKTTILVLSTSWKDDILFTFVGLLLAIGLIWFLEEIRAHNRGKI